jgi:hypothetical protein
MRMVSLSDVGCEDYKGYICPTDGTVYGALKANGLKWSFWTTDTHDSYSAWFVHHHPDVYLRTDERHYSHDFLCVR